MSFKVNNILVNDCVNQINYENNVSQVLSGTGAINLTTNVTNINNTGSSYNITLGNTVIIGKQKTVVIYKNLGSYSNNITLLYNNSYGNSRSFIFGTIGDTLIFVSTTLGWNLIYSSITQTSPTIQSTSFDPSGFGSTTLIFNGNVTSSGTSTITEMGMVYNTSGSPTILDTKIIYTPSGLGSFTISNDYVDGVTYYAKAYAINSVGTSYGSELSAYAGIICLAKGTLITLSDGTTKLIENIDYSDNLKVWNFDLGCFDTAKPLWIKKPQICNSYNSIEFNDGTILKTIEPTRGHKIYNKDLGKFTESMGNDTPIGTRTFTDKKTDVFLVDRKIIYEPTEYYNILTNYYMNIFANGILTSTKYNNIYPIVDMKFVKDNRQLISIDKYLNIPQKYFEGLRLAEQNKIPTEYTIEYIKYRETLRK